MSNSSFNSSSGINVPLDRTTYYSTLLIANLLFILLFFTDAISADTLSQTVFKQEPAEDIEYLDYLLDVVVSSGSFLELNIENSPASITFITQEEIRVSGHQEAEDQQTRASGNDCSVSLRANPPPAGESRSLVLDARCCILRRAQRYCESALGG